MLNSEERREVAETLRKCGAELSILSAGCETAFHVIDKAIGCRDEDSWERFFARLADLIDRPTCDMDVLDTGEVADYECNEHIMHCCNCGAEFGYVLYSEDGDVSMDDKPRFCPNCGARVVGE